MGIKPYKKESMERCDSCGAPMSEYEYDRYGGLCKLCRGEESKAHSPDGKPSGIQGNEALTFTAAKNPEQEVFIIDCGSAEKAKALNDAFDDAAHNENGSLTSKNLGGDPVNWWNAGQFFAACVDPCGKAASWCEDWLRNSVGRENKANEELSPKMQKRLKLKAWQVSSNKMKGFDEAGYSFLDLYEDGRCDPIAVPTKGYETEKEALAAAKEIFDDFDEYLEVTALFDEEGGPDGEAVWFPAYGLKKTFVDLPEGEGLEVLSELSDVLYRLYTKGA